MKALLAAIPVALWSFADSDNGFVPTGNSGQWEWGIPTSGPGGADPVWATRLTGDYFNDAVDELVVPVPDLTTVVDPVLTVRHWHRIQPGDLGTIEVDDGNGWVTVDPIFGYPGSGGFTGDSGGWIDTSVDLSMFGSTPTVRFRFLADSSVGDAGWYLSDVGVYDGDVTAPQVTPVLLPTDTEVIDQGYPVRLLVEDDTAVVDVSLNWSVDGGSTSALPMVDVGGGIYEGILPASPPGSSIAWTAVASDGTQERTWPDVGAESFRVYLAAPTDLGLTATGRVVGDRAELGWTAPESIHTVLSYRIEAVESNGEGPWVVFEPFGEVDLVVDGARTFQVRAVYDVGVGDASDPVVISADVPSLSSVWPPGAWQGDRVRIELAGRNLYLSDDAAADFGEGVVVESIDVVDVDHAVVLIEIGEDAVVGLHDVVVAGAYGSFAFEDRFEVLDGETAPRIVEVAPREIRQGASETVVIRASQAFYGPVIVDAGSGVVVHADPKVEEDTLTLELTVSGNAAPGPNTLVLDDGNRLWTADILVEERLYTGETGCGGCKVGTNPSGFPGWLALLLVARRRL